MEQFCLADRMEEMQSSGGFGKRRPTDDRWLSSLSKDLSLMKAEKAEFDAFEQSLKALNDLPVQTLIG
jgi:hypothetical protein